MKVILTKDLPQLGEKNTLQEVRNGYARNYLFPKGLAIIANAQNQKIAAENIRQASHKMKKQKEEAQAIAQKMEDTTFTLKVKASESGTIFGSITSLQISKMLQGHEIDLPSKQIALTTPIKEVGKDYSVDVDLGYGVKAILKITPQTA